MKRIKPDIGHLVRARKDSAVERDLGGVLGLVIGKEGISVEILLPMHVKSLSESHSTVWCHRNNFEVIG
jgi:hypothetical protein